MLKKTQVHQMYVKIMTEKDQSLIETGYDFNMRQTYGYEAFIDM